MKNKNKIILHLVIFILLFSSVVFAGQAIKEPVTTLADFFRSLFSTRYAALGQLDPYEMGGVWVQTTSWLDKDPYLETDALRLSWRETTYNVACDRVLLDIQISKWIQSENRWVLPNQGGNVLYGCAGYYRRSLGTQTGRKEYKEYWDLSNCNAGQYLVKGIMYCNTEDKDLTQEWSMYFDVCSSSNPSCTNYVGPLPTTTLDTPYTSTTSTTLQTGPVECDPTKRPCIKDVNNCFDGSSKCTTYNSETKEVTGTFKIRNYGTDMSGFWIYEMQYVPIPQYEKYPMSIKSLFSIFAVYPLTGIPGIVSISAWLADHGIVNVDQTVMQLFENSGKQVMCDSSHPENQYVFFKLKSGEEKTITIKAKPLVQSDKYKIWSIIETDCHAEGGTYSPDNIYISDYEAGRGVGIVDATSGIVISHLCTVPLKTDFQEIFRLAGTCSLAYTKNEFKVVTDDMIGKTICRESGNCIEREGYEVTCVRKEEAGVSMVGTIWDKIIGTLLGAPEPGVCLATPISSGWCGFAEKLAFFDITGDDCTDGTYIIVGGVILLFMIFALMGRK